ncbi:hypothetical protein GCM10023224_04930 [Streptomonospora halophila]|uniref:Peptidoglycan binding-like domain-containing protein n=1 Tax=Streptomonospora halophila TaxID=427369 RepID=A0ABP9G6N2_9ACTN
MAIGKAALFEWLRDQRGYREGPRSNQQKYSPSVPGLEWSNYQPWCATFTCAGFLAAGGRPNVDFPLTASCLQQVAWGRARGRLYSRAKSGDLMMIGPGGGTHVEIVVRVSGAYVTTIGGNTSGSWGGDYANGDGVYQKTRSMASAYAYVRPRYGTSTRTIEGEDDVPDFSWYSAGEGQVLQPGQWTTLELSNKQGAGKGKYWSVVFGESVYNLAAMAVLDGTDLPEGAEVQMRASHYEKRGGVDLPDGILKRGASGAKVRRVQEWLDEHGYDLGRWGTDGKYGGTTEDAVEAFQRDAGLFEDGEYGPNTEEAMEEKSGTGSWEINLDHAIGTPSIHAGGNCHVAYHLPEKVLKGHRVRVRVVQYGDKPVKVKSAHVYLHEWK